MNQNLGVLTFLLATVLKVFPQVGQGSWADRCDSMWLINFFFVSKLAPQVGQGNEAVPEWTLRWSFKSRACLKNFKQTSQDKRSPEKYSFVLWKDSKV